jgi:hypothetical protein
MKDKWMIINQVNGKQARHLDGTLTPTLENPTQCIKYIQNKLGNSQIFIPWRIK